MKPVELQKFTDEELLQMLEDSPQSLIFGHQRSAPGPGEPGFAIPVSSVQGKDKP